MKDSIIKLVELANTWQGEGPDTGRLMTIARFKYCDKHCAFCDTWIKMKITTEGNYTIQQINETLEKTRGLMITGGEPTFEVPNKISNLTDTLRMLHMCNYEVANVETNGCDIVNLLKGMNSDVVSKTKVMYSPKIFSEKDFERERNILPIIIDHPSVYVKIVADTNGWVDGFIKYATEIRKNRSKIYLMPLGVTPEEIMKNWPRCIDLADEYNCNLSTRMHIMNQFV